MIKTYDEAIQKWTKQYLFCVSDTFGLKEDMNIRVFRKVFLEVFDITIILSHIKDSNDTTHGYAGYGYGDLSPQDFNDKVIPIPSLAYKIHHGVSVHGRNYINIDGIAFGDYNKFILGCLFIKEIYK